MSFLFQSVSSPLTLTTVNLLFNFNFTLSVFLGVVLSLKTRLSRLRPLTHSVLPVRVISLTGYTIWTPSRSRPRVLIVLRAYNDVSLVGLPTPVYSSPVLGSWDIRKDSWLVRRLSLKPTEFRVLTVLHVSNFSYADRRHNSFDFFVLVDSLTMSVGPFSTTIEPGPTNVRCVTGRDRFTGGSCYLYEIQTCVPTIRGLCVGHVHSLT